MKRQRYLFKFYYIGAEKFFGSQRQLNLLTIEGCLLSALKEKNYVKDVKSSGFEVASRTDRCVSALGSVFSFITEKKPILMEINTALPKEIGIWAFVEVPIDFLSRFNAVYRHYKYIFPKPLNYIQKKYAINLEVMRKACNELEGQHDFLNFSKREKLDVKTIRDIYSAKMTIINDFLIFDFKSRAFLRQQVLRMVKKIFELGVGEINYNDFLKLFDASNYISYSPANPNGLILWDIKFGNTITFKIEAKSKERMKNYFLNQELKFGLKKQLFKILEQNNFS